MQHYTFNTTIEKGMIPVPADILTELSSQVKVVIYAKNNNVHLKQYFSALELQTKEFKFNREEANER
jgi:hypothetical protein